MARIHDCIDCTRSFSEWAYCDIQEISFGEGSEKGFAVIDITE